MEILKHNRVGSEKVKYNWVCLNESGVIELSNWIALSTGPLPKEEACSQRDTSQLGLKLSQDIFLQIKKLQNRMINLKIILLKSLVVIKLSWNIYDFYN